MACTGDSSLGRECSSIGLPWGHKCCQETCSTMGSSLHEATGPAWSLHQCGFLTESQGIHLLWCGVLCGLQMDLCSPWDPHGLQGHRCLTMGCTRGCRGISALVPGAPPPSASSVSWVCLQGCFPHILSPLFWRILADVGFTVT